MSMQEKDFLACFWEMQGYEKVVSEVFFIGELYPLCVVITLCGYNIV